MAGTVVPTIVDFGSLKRFSFVWTSTAGGTVSATLSNLEEDVIKFNGMLTRVTFVPASVSTPTDNYDLTINDDFSMDVLAGQGSNLSNTTSTDITGGVNVTDGTYNGVLPFSVVGELDLSVINAGNAKKGTVILYFS